MSCAFIIFISRIYTLKIKPYSCVFDKSVVSSCLNQQRCDLPADRLSAWLVVAAAAAARRVDVMAQQLPSCRVTRRRLVDFPQPAFDRRVRVLDAQRRLHPDCRRRTVEHWLAHAAAVRRAATVCERCNTNNTLYHSVSLYECALGDIVFSISNISVDAVVDRSVSSGISGAQRCESSWYLLETEYYVCRLFFLPEWHCGTYRACLCFLAFCFYLFIAITF